MIEIVKIPAGEQVSQDYEISIEGIDCQADIARVSAAPINTPDETWIRPLDQTELVSFLSCYADEPLRIVVKPNRAFREVAVRPLSANVTANIAEDGTSFSLTVEKPGQYSIELDGAQRPLYLFVNPIGARIANPSAYRYYFGEGVHRPGKITVESGDKIYIAPGAVVYGSIYGDGVQHISVTGGGILDGSYELRQSERCYEDDTIGCVKFYRSEDIVISGIICRDPAIWTINFFDCNKVSVDYVKLIGYRYNSDGIDICNSSNVTISHCFLRCFDDCVVVKGVPGYQYKNTENIFVSDCVVWCDWGRALEIGAETVAEEMRNIRFTNCDMIHTIYASLDIQNCDRATVHDVVYENIRMEYSKFQSHSPVSVMMSVFNGYGGIHFDDPSVVGQNCDVEYRNLTIFTDESLDAPKFIFTGYDATHQNSNIRFDGVFINGKRVTALEELSLQCNEYVSGISLK